MIPMVAPFALILGLMAPPAIGQDEPAPPPRDEPQAEAGADAGYSRELAEDLAMLDALLRVRETRITEARRQLEFEQDILAALRDRQQAGGLPARMIEEAEARVMNAEALLEARQADHDELAIRLAQARRIADSPSPEPDLDEQRTRLDEEVRIREAQLRAREARVTAAEAQLTAEEHKREQFRDSIRRGTEGPGRIRQANFRVAEAAAWRDTMTAEREVSRLVLERAQRRRTQFDDPDAPDPTLDRLAIDDLPARVNTLESLIDILRDELYQVRWELQAIQNRLP